MNVDVRHYLLVFMLLAVCFSCAAERLYPDGTEYQLTILYSANTLGHINPCTD